MTLCHVHFIPTRLGIFRKFSTICFSLGESAAATAAYGSNCELMDFRRVGRDRVAVVGKEITIKYKGGLFFYPVLFATITRV